MCLREVWRLKLSLCVLQADAQIYNKVLSLMEDWADAINLPAYRQEYNNLKVRRRGAHRSSSRHMLKSPISGSKHIPCTAGLPYLVLTLPLGSQSRCPMCSGCGRQ